MILKGENAWNIELYAYSQLSPKTLQFYYLA